MGVFDALVQFFTTVLSFLYNFVAGFVQLVAIIPSALSMLTYSFNQLPPVLVAFAVAFVSVSVVYLIIGR